MANNDHRLFYNVPAVFIALSFTPFYFFAVS